MLLSESFVPYPEDASIQLLSKSQATRQIEAQTQTGAATEETLET